jgi:hypothetical protein
LATPKDLQKKNLYHRGRTILKEYFSGKEEEFSEEIEEKRNSLNK